MIDTSFLENLLMFIIVSCSIYYFFIQKNHGNNSELPDDELLSANNNNSNNISEKFMPVMPIKRTLGPVHNFHEQFNKRLNTQKYKELGWRNWWSKNKRCSKLSPETGFEGTIVKNYLTNMDNVKNMFL